LGWLHNLTSFLAAYPSIQFYNKNVHWKIKTKERLQTKDSMNEKVCIVRGNIKQN
jgi:hypothetical protein